MELEENNGSGSGGGGGVVVKMVEIEGKGKGLVSTKALKGGSIILTDSPILVYSALPFSNNTPRYCFNCFRTLKTTRAPLSCPSSGCSNHDVGGVLFCSPNCQSLSLSSTGSHSPWVCQTLGHLQSYNKKKEGEEEEDLLVQSRFLVAAYNLSPSHLQILLSLHGQPSPLDFAAAHLFHSIVVSPPPFPFPISVGFFSVELSATLLAKDKHNAFGLMEPQPTTGCIRSVRAYGIYPKASLFNHDCLPNACRFDYLDSAPDIANSNTDLIFRLIHDVPQGREICLSYFPVNENYSNRQKRLLDDYGFICDCDRCKVEANWSDDHDSMDEDHDELMSADDDDDDNDNDNDNNNDNDDFPHSYFFLRYVCNRENCWGTLAPLPPSDTDTDTDASPSKFLECNVCGILKMDEDFGD